MISFIDYICEQSGVFPGNYVSADCDHPKLPEHLLPKTGKKTDDSSAHITLMYSKNTAIDKRVIDNVLSLAPHVFSLRVDSAACFDSQDSEDECCIVLKVHSPVAVQLHDTMKSLGMVHSYDEFSPHVTIAYGVKRDEGYALQQQITDWIISNPMSLQTKLVKHAPIDTEWVNKL